MIEGAECYPFCPKWHTYSPTSQNKQEYAHTSATQKSVAGVMSRIGWQRVSPTIHTCASLEMIL